MREIHCSTCTCDLTEVSWSDREGWVDLNDARDIADTVMGCALDHSYDRDESGIPCGFPDKMRDRLAPVVADYLSRAEPDWKNKTVYMYDKPELRESFKQALIAVAQEIIDG